MPAAVNARCMTPTCPWVGRSRPLRLDTVGLGAGLFGILRVLCECGAEPDLDVVAVQVPIVRPISSP